MEDTLLLRIAKGYVNRIQKGHNTSRVALICVYLLMTVLLSIFFVISQCPFFLVMAIFFLGCAVVMAEQVLVCAYLKATEDAWKAKIARLKEGEIDDTAQRIT